jgi:hypothetical protein
MPGKRKEYNPFDVPEKPPNLNVTVDTLFPDGSVKLLIENQDNGKKTYKTYKTIEEAQRLAAFTACTLGVGTRGSLALQAWLTSRGFPGFAQENRDAMDKQLREAREAQDNKEPVFKVVEDDDDGDEV